MKLRRFISRTANKFFYLQNLFPWHFATRTDHRERWEKITGRLTKEEEFVVHEFAELLKITGYRYDRSGKSLFPGVPFLTHEKDTEGTAFKKAENFLTKKQLFVFRRAFDILEPKFSKIWSHYKDSRSQIDDLFTETDSETFKKLARKAGALCDTPDELVINISIILSPAPAGKTAAGSAIPGYDTITLEIPEQIDEEWVKIYSIGVLIHEAIHVMLEKNNMIKKIGLMVRKLDLPSIINDKPTSVWINEAIVESFAPSGFLIQNYYENKIADCLLANADKAYICGNSESLRHYLLLKNYPMAVYYSRNKKPIDKFFIKNVGISLKDFLEKKEGGF